MAPWQGYRLPPEGIEQRLRAVVAERRTLCLLGVEGGFVTLDPQLAAERPYLADRLDPLGLRVGEYLDLLNEASAIFGLTGNGVIALFVDDVYPAAFNDPIFCFQKRRGTRGLLLPDVDFMNWNFYSKPDDDLNDRRSFAEKEDAAIFVGSTTGSIPMTAADVIELRNKRLRTAVRFRDSERIHFHLPHIVQCDDQVTEGLVRDLNVAGRFWTWQEQLAFRYLLSMDGNGATCSRVVLALKSQSILLKYNSPHQLYYFHGLEAWRHYVPIIDDQDVEDVLNDSHALEHVFESIVANASVFARSFLSRLSVLRYSAEILSSYLQVFGEGAEPLQDGAPRMLIDLEAHIANRGMIWAKPGAWLSEAPTFDAIEGFRLIGSGLLPDDGFHYTTFDQQGLESGSHDPDQFCGTYEQARPLYGIRITLGEPMLQDYHLSYAARFADGFESPMVRSGTALHRSAPLTDLQVSLRPR